MATGTQRTVPPVVKGGFLVLAEPRMAIGLQQIYCVRPETDDPEGPCRIYYGKGEVRVHTPYAELARILGFAE